MISKVGSRAAGTSELNVTYQGLLKLSVYALEVKLI